MLNINKLAPDFSAYDAKNNLHKLSDYRGKKVILYFYPKDNTSGCSTQACGYAKFYNDFSNLNTVVIGVSKDTSKSHASFIKKYKLPFILLADPQRAILKLYDVLKPKKMFGKEVIGTHRNTFIINENGIIIGIYKDVNPHENPSLMLKAIKEMV